MPLLPLPAPSANMQQCPLPAAQRATRGTARSRRGIVDNRLVPRLAAFYGIVIWMYRPNHPPPHFHAQYGEHVAQIELETLRVLHGSLPGRALRLVEEWARLHESELAENWRLAQALEPLAAIDPLA